ILIDRISNATVAAGMVLGRSSDEILEDHWETPTDEQPLVDMSRVSADERRARYGQTGASLLLTGLPGAGKSTIAYALERRLFDAGRAVTVLDGTAMRKGISKDLGFSAQERSENLRRSTEVAKLINDSGLLCICAFVAPSEEVRQKARNLVGAERIFVVHLDTPLAVCRQRDHEGYYAAADRGEIPSFPGVSYTYEKPVDADLVLDTVALSVDMCVEAIVTLLEERGII